MKATLLRAGALSCALLASTALTAPAMAQTAPPPRFNQVDRNGVDLVSGDYFFSMVEGSIGSGEGALTLVRNWAGPAGWTDNWSGAAYLRTIGGAQQVVVEFGSYSDRVTIPAGATPRRLAPRAFVAAHDAFVETVVRERVLVGFPYISTRAEHILAASFHHMPLE